MSSHYPKRSVYNADAACALPGVLAELLVDSVPGERNGPGRIELLAAVPAFLPSGRLRGIRTLAGVRVAELHWNTGDTGDTGARTAEAVLVSATGCAADVSCWSPATVRRVTPRAGIPARMRWKWEER